MTLSRFNNILSLSSMLIVFISLVLFTLISPHNAYATSPLPAYTVQATPTTGTGPLTVVFTFPGGGFNTGGYWTLQYGDGQSDLIAVPADFSGTIQKTHTYESAGTYNAKVVETNNPELDIPYANTTITVTSGSKSSTASLSATPSTVTAPSSVTFTASGLGTVGGYWTLYYGDGQSDLIAVPADTNTTTREKTHTYSSAGTYTARLVSNSTNSEVSRTTVTVNEVTTTSDITLTASPSTGTAPLSVTFTASGFGTMGGYWTLYYGDGQSDLIAVPADMNTPTQKKTHTYSSTGTYTAKLADSSGKTIDEAKVKVSKEVIEDEDEEDEGDENLRQQLITLIQLLLKQLQDRGTSVSLNSSTNNVNDTCVNISSPLYVGANDQSTNGDVSRLQNFLRATGDYTYSEITGFYGQSTLQAVQKWQARNGVVSSGTPASTGYGLVGAATRVAMSCQ